MADLGMTELDLDSSGARLRRAREARGMTLAELSAQTKIPERLIVAIEEGNFPALPARAYAVGFSRSIARIVGLDENEITKSVRAELDGVSADDATAAPTFEPGDPARVPSSGLAWIAGLGALVVVLGVVVFWRSYYSPGMTLPSLAPKEAPVAAVATTSPSPVAAPAAPTGGPVVFTATAPEVWVKFYDASGVQLLQKQLALGESYTVPDTAKGPMIWTARPEALTITIGGQPVPPLADRQVTLKDIPVTAEALLARGSTPPATAPVAVSPAAATAPRTRSVAPRPQASVPQVPAASVQVQPSLAATPSSPAAQPSTVSN